MSVNYPDNMDSSTILPGEDCPEMPDIKPCPFCGSEEVGPRETPLVSLVECYTCRAFGPIADDELAAINAWNRRVV